MHKKMKGDITRVVVDILLWLLVIAFKTTNAKKRALADELSTAVPDETANHVDICFADHGYPGVNAIKSAPDHDMA